MPLTVTDIAELFLMSTASRYDLTKREERVRSVQSLEHLFFRVCRELQPDLFVEAGANDPETSRRARKYINGRIVAFEANPIAFEKFVSDANTAKRVEYIHAALSDADGETTFNVRIVDSEPVADGKSSLIREIDETVEYQKFVVNAHRMDSYFPSDSTGHWVMWVDVEGASEYTLKGAAAILDRCDAVYIEVNDRPIWQDQWLAEDVINFLDDYDLVPVARDFQSRYQYNILFLKRRLIRNPRIRLFLIEYFGETTIGVGGGSPDLFALDQQLNSDTEQ